MKCFKKTEIDNNKKVIFISGISYSGTTLLDMILSNDANGFSLGEIHALFRPYRVHHFEKIKDINNNSTKWKNILQKDEKKLYSNLFETFPDVKFFVDSSKNPFWISRHMKILDKLGINYKNI